MPARKKKSKPKRYHILHHELVPNHVILSDKEKKELLKQYDILPEQLPKILNTDPTAISIEAKPGQIIKIIRKSQTADESIAYRLVIESEGSWSAIR